MSGHIAALSDSVTRKKVVYKNRYSLDITRELYHAKDKELYEMADAEHIDLYDRTDRIPFDKLAEFSVPI